MIRALVLIVEGKTYYSALQRWSREKCSCNCIRNLDLNMMFL